jgi:hypothetical protein
MKSKFGFVYAGDWRRIWIEKNSKDGQPTERAIRETDSGGGKSTIFLNCNLKMGAYESDLKILDWLIEAFDHIYKSFKDRFVIVAIVGKHLSQI